MGSTAAASHLRAVPGPGPPPAPHRGECPEVLCVTTWSSNLEGVGKAFLLMKSWKQWHISANIERIKILASYTQAPHKLVSTGEGRDPGAWGEAAAGGRGGGGGGDGEETEEGPEAGQAVHLSQECPPLGRQWAPHLSCSPRLPGAEGRGRGQRASAAARGSSTAKGTELGQRLPPAAPPSAPALGLFRAPQPLPLRPREEASG